MSADVNETKQATQEELDSAYDKAYEAFMKHVSNSKAKCDCRRGVDCEEAGALKIRMRETRSASLAAERAAKLLKELS